MSAATVNREMNLLACVFEEARREWKWCLTNPLRDVRRPPKPLPRTRVMLDGERDKLSMALGYVEAQPITTVSQQVAVAMLLALGTAMRSSEITTLLWADVYLARRFVPLQETKNGDRRDVPLSTWALDLLRKLEGLVPDRVFTVDPYSETLSLGRRVIAAVSWV